MNYYSDDDDDIYILEKNKEFSIDSSTIDKKDDNTILCKINFIDIVSYSTSWCYNRKIYDEKVDELYNDLILSYNIPYILHGIYDDKKDCKKILILDGQHRIEAINKFIIKNNIEVSKNSYIWIWLYKIDYSETICAFKAISLFKKINNNRLLEDSDLPDEFIICIIDDLCKVSKFTKYIGCKSINNTCRSPMIHKKELNEAFNIYKKDLYKKNIYMIIKHIIQMNTIIGEKSFEELYQPGYRKLELKRYLKAKEIGFYLNLKNSNYSLLEWIKKIL
jgi:hypothetical protein